MIAIVGHISQAVPGMAQLEIVPAGEDNLEFDRDAVLRPCVNTVLDKLIECDRVGADEL